jgi:hypothetical protein
MARSWKKDVKLSLASIYKYSIMIALLTFWYLHVSGSRKDDFRNKILLQQRHELLSPPEGQLATLLQQQAQQHTQTQQQEAQTAQKTRPARDLPGVEVWAAPPRQLEEGTLSEVRVLGSHRHPAAIGRLACRCQCHCATQPPPPPTCATPGDAAPPCRCFLQVAALLTEDERQQLSELCGRCLYHSLYSVIVARELGSTVFVATGDIPDMWIRDSSVQVGILLPRMARHPGFRVLVEGAIRAQAFFITQV